MSHTSLAGAMGEAFRVDCKVEGFLHVDLTNQEPKDTVHIYLTKEEDVEYLIQFLKDRDFILKNKEIDHFAQHSRSIISFEERRSKEEVNLCIRIPNDFVKHWTDIKELNTYSKFGYQTIDEYIKLYQENLKSQSIPDSSFKTILKDSSLRVASQQAVYAARKLILKQVGKSSPKNLLKYENFLNTEAGEGCIAMLLAFISPNLPLVGGMQKMSVFANELQTFGIYKIGNDLFNEVLETFKAGMSVMDTLPDEQVVQALPQGIQSTVQTVKENVAVA